MSNPNSSYISLDRRDYDPLMQVANRLNLKVTAQNAEGGSSEGNFIVNPPSHPSFKISDPRGTPIVPSMRALLLQEAQKIKGSPLFVIQEEIGERATTTTEV